MNKQEFIKYWVTSSLHDLELAASLYKLNHFDYCLFLSHLSLEKLLKALWVEAHGDNFAPKTPNAAKPQPK